jgi:hypothetical protein
MKAFSVLFTAIYVIFVTSAGAQSWIRINQLGYTPMGIKSAVWCSKSDPIPSEVYLENVVPMFKVRHNDYLTMIYGIDFKSNFKDYWQKRYTRKKERASINQWKISQALLKIKDGDINSENPIYIGLISARILEEEFEESLDKSL